MKALSTIKKEFLIEVTTQLVAKERAVTADLIRHLREIERRGLHLEMGYGSMFELLTKRFSYSEGAADRRISAMRLARDVPGVMEAIESGRLSLSAASQAQHFFKNESKRGKAYTPAE